MKLNIKEALKLVSIREYFYGFSFHPHLLFVTKLPNLHKFRRIPAKLTSSHLTDKINLDFNIYQMFFFITYEKYVYYCKCSAKKKSTISYYPL